MNICNYIPIKQPFDVRGINERFNTLFKQVCFLASAGGSIGTQGLASVLSHGDTANNPIILDGNLAKLIVTDGTIDSVLDPGILTFSNAAGFATTIAADDNVANISIQMPLGSGRLARLSDIPLGGPMTINNQTADYTLQEVDGDNNTLVNMNVVIANTITVDSAVFDFPIGTSIMVGSQGDGQTTIVAAGTTVILTPNGVDSELSFKNSGGVLIKISSTEWYFWGDVGEGGSGGVSLPDMEIGFGDGSAIISSPNFTFDSISTSLSLISDEASFSIESSTGSGSAIMGLDGNDSFIQLNAGDSTCTFIHRSSTGFTGINNSDPQEFLDVIGNTLFSEGLMSILNENIGTNTPTDIGLKIINNFDAIEGVTQNSPCLILQTKVFDDSTDTAILQGWTVQVTGQQGVGVHSTNFIIKNIETGLVPLTFQENGASIFNNGIIFDSVRHILANGTITYAAHTSSTTNHLFVNEIQALDANVALVKMASSSTSSGANAKVLEVLGDAIDAGGTSKPVLIATCSGTLGSGTATPNILSQGDFSSIGKGMLIPRMTTSQRDGIGKYISSVTVVTPGSGIVGSYFATPSGSTTGIVALLTPVISGGALTGVTINERGSNYLTGGTIVFTGTSTVAPTATYTVGTATIPAGMVIYNTTTNTFDYYNGTSWVSLAPAPYMKYVALLSQVGTSAPTATVLENTLGGAIVWTRDSNGVYTGTLTGAFTNNKTVCLANSGGGGILSSEVLVNLGRVTDNTISLSSYDSATAITDDGLLANATITIYVYQ